MLRCLFEGVRRLDPSIADDMQAHTDCFDIVAWTYPFYKEHHDIEVDRAGIEAVLLQQAPTPLDREQASGWGRRLQLAIHRLVDRLPYLIPKLANEKTTTHIRDLRRYVIDEEGLGQSTRELLKRPLLQAWHDDRPTLLIGHSMGSIISYDTLWQLSVDESEFALDTFVSFGTPLGQTFVQRKLLGAGDDEPRRYPRNIRCWDNVVAVGDQTSIDALLADDFASMTQGSYSTTIRDHRCYNFFRNGGAGGELNVHAEYGYLINAVTATLIADWWREKRGQLTNLIGV